MSTTTDGQICYGIMFDEGYKFPWDTEQWDGDSNEWWLYEVCRYRNPFELYENGGYRYIGGVKPPNAVIKQYHDAKHNFLAKHPFPVKEVNYCSCEVPMYIIAIERTVIEANRGYPTVFDPVSLVVTEAERENLIEFCLQYLQPINDGDEFPLMEPQWYLSSYWG